MTAAEPSGRAPNPSARRSLDRALRTLRRSGAWIDAAGESFVVRLSPDRRRRPALRIDRQTLAALEEAHGLRPRAGGGWILVGEGGGAGAAPPPGRPGYLEGEILVADGDGRAVHRRGNLGESALMWLARRKGPDGEPFISPLELLAGERFRRDQEAAGRIGRLTMDWSGFGGGEGAGPRLEPAERARAAKARVHAALHAVGPAHGAILERICVGGSALQLVERELGLRPRSGKVLLRSALAALVRHYRLGP